LRQWRSCRQWARYHAEEEWRLRGDAQAYLAEAQRPGAARWAAFCEARHCVRMAAWHEGQSVCYRGATLKVVPGASSEL
jgi:hypothetical protein